MKCGFQTTDGAQEQFVLYRFVIVQFCCVTRVDNKVRSPIFFFIENGIYLQKAIHRWKGQGLSYFST